MAPDVKTGIPFWRDSGFFDAGLAGGAMPAWGVIRVWRVAPCPHGALSGFGRRRHARMGCYPGLAGGAMPAWGVIRVWRVAPCPHGVLSGLGGRRHARMERYPGLAHRTMPICAGGGYQMKLRSFSYFVL